MQIVNPIDYLHGNDQLIYEVRPAESFDDFNSAPNGRPADNRL